VSVFLRWGIFGILAFAGLMYAYNASKRLAERKQSQPATVVSAKPEAVSDNTAAQVSVTPACQEELDVALLAMKSRRDGEPIDRLLRMQVIAFQPDPKRRQRLETVARKWFDWVGAEPGADALRDTALSDCWKFSPAP